MEEKKRKKSKKKNRSAQSQSTLSHPQPSEAPNSSNPHHIQCSNLNVGIQANPLSFPNGNSRGKVEASDGVALAGDKTGLRPEQFQVFVSEDSSPLPASDPPLNPDGNVQQEMGSEDGPEFQIQKRNFENVARDRFNKLPDRVSNHTQTETDLHDEDARLREELTAKEQLVYELREALATKTEIAETLRADLDELRTAHDRFQVAKHAETQQLAEESIHLREENIRLSKEVEEMRDLIERLLLEHQQLTAKMEVIQAGGRQLDCVAAPHAHFKDEVAVVASPESSKATEDELAKVKAAAEESDRQLAAAASIVERLVTENSELLEKINEQSALIDRLAQRYSSVVESQSDGFLEKSVPEQKDMTTSANTDEVDRGNSEAQDLYKISSPGHNGASSLDEEDIQAQRTVTPSLVTVVSTSNAVLPVEFDQVSQEVPEEIISDAMSGIASPANLQESAFMKPVELKPFSDAPISGAPIRLFNFITRYVSGADLVKT